MGAGLSAGGVADECGREGLGIPYENVMEVPETPRYRKVAMF